ncbi:5027_t:CDS:2 [Funneliformis geosporum]|uniref:14127_t:CDS:1 n=1 Tax=Funneliformis geosporum TaxID=1117311 RepID=A0A9W4SKY2_9GLOM|nr:5027_t:CDS:2 [Funneliformis geosporum]CAI2172406.1 14127_t:CDS:2 [Funneliformis geosporum]
MNTSKTFAVFFVLFLAFISSTNAHLSLVAPKRRGSDEGTMTEAPCGGFSVVNTAAISDFPVTDGVATTKFEDGNGMMYFNYAPTSDGPFMPVSDNVTINVPEGSNDGAQFQTNITLSLANAKVGDSGVLQAIYNSTSGNTTWYQCADIKVVNAKVSADARAIGADMLASLIFSFASLLMIL